MWPGVCSDGIECGRGRSAKEGREEETGKTLGSCTLPCLSISYNVLLIWPHGS